MSEQRVVVMGLGNLLWADEGFGVRVAERLYAHYHWPEYVEIVDGGTQGLNLLGYVESASHLLILDAIDYGLEPGTLRTYAGERIVPSCLIPISFNVLKALSLAPFANCARMPL